MMRNAIHSFNNNRWQGWKVLSFLFPSVVILEKRVRIRFPSFLCLNAQATLVTPSIYIIRGCGPAVNLSWGKYMLSQGALDLRSLEGQIFLCGNSDKITSSEVNLMANMLRKINKNSFYFKLHFLDGIKYDKIYI